jgi:hypothetical protein
MCLMRLNCCGVSALIVEARIMSHHRRLLESVRGMHSPQPFPSSSVGSSCYPVDSPCKIAKMPDHAKGRRKVLSTGRFGRAKTALSACGSHWPTFRRGRSRLSWIDVALRRGLVAALAATVTAIIGSPPDRILLALTPLLLGFRLAALCIAPASRGSVLGIVDSTGRGIAGLAGVRPSSWCGVV